MVTAYDTKLPWWAVLITTVVPALYMVPCGIVQGITNQDVNTLNVMSEFAAGYIWQGKPLANMIFKNLSVDVITQGLYFVADMKLAHYMKVPPRTLFFAQGIAVVLGSLTQAGVTLWMLGNVKDICQETQPNGYTCPGGRTVFSSSIVWGAIGPARSYSIGQIYSGLLHFFWIGALMPVSTWIIWKYWKKPGGKSRDYIRLLNWPIIFLGTINTPPATGINYSSWAVTNVTFNWWLKKKYFAWWSELKPSLCRINTSTNRR
jgi:OPT family oligopeptide transporter